MIIGIKVLGPGTANRAVDSGQLGPADIDPGIFLAAGELFAVTNFAVQYRDVIDPSLAPHLLHPKPVGVIEVTANHRAILGHLHQLVQQVVSIVPGIDGTADGHDLDSEIPVRVILVIIPFRPF